MSREEHDAFLHARTVIHAPRTELLEWFLIIAAVVGMCLIAAVMYAAVLLVVNVWPW